jgi:SAM-dependent methyltransferase
LQQREGLERIVGAVMRGDRHGALMEALNAFRVTWARKSRIHQITYRLACRRLLAAESTSFREAVNLVRKPQGFADYLLHRWANPSFLAATATMAVLEQLVPADDGRKAGVPDAPSGVRTRARILDLACGAGHSSFLMRLLYPQIEVVSADHDFVSLYLARRFFGEDGTYVCIDAEAPSPFPDNHFQAVFCLDAFHYFRSKRATVQELRRVAMGDALWLFPHLHNALQENVTPGVPLAPEKYLELFEFAAPRIFDEMALLQEIVETQRLDLRAAADPQVLRRANALSLIGGGTDTWRVYTAHFHRVARRQDALAFNPIYAHKPTTGGLSLNIEWPNPVMRRECGAVEAVLPRALDVSLPLPLDTSAPRSTLSDLISRFVIVPVPPKYGHVSAKAVSGAAREQGCGPWTSGRRA